MPKSRKASRKSAQPRKTGRNSSKPAKKQQSVAKAASSRALKMRSGAPSSRPSKKGAILALLQQPKGAAIEDLIAATGWQVHSVRAALTGLRKEGRKLLRDRDAAGITHYRLLAA